MGWPEISAPPIPTAPAGTGPRRRDAGPGQGQAAVGFALNFCYLTRPYIVYRSRDPQLGARPARRGWERVQ